MARRRGGYANVKLNGIQDSDEMLQVINMMAKINNSEDKANRMKKLKEFSKETIWYSYPTVVCQIASLSMNN